MQSQNNFLLLVVFITIAISCSDSKPRYCTQIFAGFLVNIKDSANNPVTLDTNYTVFVKTNMRFHLGTDSLYKAKGSYKLIDDSKKNLIPENQSIEILFIGVLTP
jgi:hypothetical protein